MWFLAILFPYIYSLHNTFGKLSPDQIFRKHSVSDEHGSPNNIVQLRPTIKPRPVGDRHENSIMLKNSYLGKSITWLIKCTTFFKSCRPSYIVLLVKHQHYVLCLHNKEVCKVWIDALWLPCPLNVMQINAVGVFVLRMLVKYLIQTIRHFLLSFLYM